MNVLSLFDGISCGQLALQRANIPYDNYFASEIDKYAILITQKHFPKTIQLGDIIKWADWNLPQIDLLIGGSPCQGFSTSGEGLNFSDPRSKLFFKFVDCLKWFKPKYFLLENVRMKKEWRDVITSYLGVEPILINSALVSAQSRPRLYWTNIPNISQPEDKHIYLKDIIEHGTAEKEKSYCIDANYFKLGTTKHHGSKPFQQLRQSERRMIIKETDDHIKEKSNQSFMIGRLVGRRLDENGTRRDYSDIPITQRIEPRTDDKCGCLTTVQKDNIVIYPFGYRVLFPIECERLQTLPDNYTEGLSNSQRYKCIGNGWTIDVIAHIFRFIPNEL